MGVNKTPISYTFKSHFQREMTVMPGKEEDKEESWSVLRRNLIQKSCMTKKRQKSPIKCLWVKITGLISCRDLTADSCCWLPNQDAKANKAKFASIKQIVLGQPNVVLWVTSTKSTCWKWCLRFLALYIFHVFVAF